MQVRRSQLIWLATSALLLLTLGERLLGDDSRVQAGLRQVVERLSNKPAQPLQHLAGGTCGGLSEVDFSAKRTVSPCGVQSLGQDIDIHPPTIIRIDEIGP